jgi:hypothetical protein
MGTRKAVALPLIILTFAGLVRANPTPGPGNSWGESEFSVMQTLELTYHVEGFNTADSLGSWIVYGGPSFVYIWLPDDDEGTGLGLELGAEARRYVKRPLSGPFAGLYSGAGILWQSGRDYTAAISAGAKLGWRINLHEQRLPFDLEPYISVGIMLISFDGSNVWVNLAPTLYLGTKLDLY